MEMFCLTATSFIMASLTFLAVCDPVMKLGLEGREGGRDGTRYTML